ncbi:MAG: hypothetical protein JXQ75_19525 [Phycisphaerae bacterium]|nr:hypothetical protein [Phycisphaerae bacterium]
MKTKTLEQLLIDRRLGELSPDVATLLDAYLRLCPDRGSAAEGVIITIDLAERALNRPHARPEHAMPPPSRRLAMPSPGRRSLWGTWHRRFAVAAAIALAFVLGNLSELRQGTITRTDTSVTGLSNSVRRSSGFWSLERLHKPPRPRPTGNSQRLEWTTPLSQPRIGEQT